MFHGVSMAYDIDSHMVGIYLVYTRHMTFVIHGICLVHAMLIPGINHIYTRYISGIFVSYFMDMPGGRCCRAGQGLIVAVPQAIRSPGLVNMALVASCFQFWKPIKLITASDICQVYYSHIHGIY